MRLLISMVIAVTLGGLPIGCGNAVTRLDTALRGAVPSREELVGEYEVAYSFGVETLILNEDGTFEQQLEEEKNGVVIKNEGRWTFKAETGELVLHGALCLYELESDPASAKTAWEFVREPRRSGKDVRIPIFSDAGLAYRKKPE